MIKLKSKVNSTDFNLKVGQVFEGFATICGTTLQNMVFCYYANGEWQTAYLNMFEPV